MTSYRYRAMTISGTIVQGAVEAADETAVVQHIRQAGLYPVSAKPTTSRDLGIFASRFRPLARHSPQALSLATQELSTLLEAGLELDRALGILTGLSKLGPFRAPFETARVRVRDGASLADALDAEPLFPRFYVGMVRAGEMGGTLPRTLGKLADYLARSLATREAIVSALVYPVILLVTAGLSIAFILTFVLPKFEPLFEQAGKSLPLPARIVMGLGHAAQDYWWLGLLAAATAIIGTHRLLENPRLRLVLDTRLLRLPLLGELLTAMAVERFTRTMGTLLANGVPLPAALGLSKDISANTAIAKAIGDTAESLREGDALAERMRRTAVFPAMTLDLIRVGEESGKLDEMLLRQADLDEKHIRHAIDRLLAFLVPALTVFLGLIVGGLIAAIMTAILSLNDLALQ